MCVCVNNWYILSIISDLELSHQVTIGSFGIRLSGGQRARVALARAAYMEVPSRPWGGLDGLLGYDG